MAVWSRTEIYNMALGMLPRDPVTGPDEQSLAARECNRFWPIALQTVLAKADWNIARKRTALAELATNDRDAEWGYAYEVPAGMVWPVRLLPSNDSLADAGTFVPMVGQRPAFTSSADNPGLGYDMAGSTIYANEPSAVLEWIDGTTGLYGVSYAPLFVRAVAAHLAAWTALPLTKSEEKRKLRMNEAEVFTDQAVAAHLNMNPQRYGDFVPEEAMARMGIDAFNGWPAGFRQ